jgi:DNA-binding transcriptional MerR regulator
MDEKEAKTVELNRQISEWCTHMLEYRIPRWNELPEIELYMDQVIALMEKYLGVFYDDENKTITPSMINNYVKLGLIPAPVKKKYSKIHLAYILIICILKQVIPINAITRMIDHQMSKHTIEEAYDRFCEEQEKAFLSSVKKAMEINDPANEIMLEDYILLSTIAANSEKAVSGKLTAIIDKINDTEKEEKEKTKEKDTKQ